MQPQSQQVTISAVYINAEDKNGKPYMSKAGRPYKRASIKTVEHGNEYISGLASRAVENWKTGDKVTILISKKESNGKVYLNFELPDPIIVLQGQVSTLEKQMKEVMRITGMNGNASSQIAKTPYGVSGLNPNYKQQMSTTDVKDPFVDADYEIPTPEPRAYGAGMDPNDIPF